jgi:hypothetical protein
MPLVQVLNTQLKKHDCGIYELDPTQYTPYCKFLNSQFINILHMLAAPEKYTPSIPDIP